VSDGVSAPIARIRYFPVFVSDQERALAFYRDVLGMRVSVDVPYNMYGTEDFRWICVGPDRGGTQMILYHPGMAGADEESTLRDRIGEWTGVVLETDDVNAAHRELSEKGVRFASPPADQPWGGRESTFEDPDGNKFHLSELPAVR
jgi:catechol 2,3-dioxygenase-like lactoylglutathione lyase family enzyme